MQNHPKIRIEQKILKTLTDCNKERNIYTHPLPIARDIFWQRLEKVDQCIRHVLRSRPDMSRHVLDFGGGSGMMLRSLSALFETVDVIDLDVDEAVRVKEYFRLDNVHIIQGDIFQFKTTTSYDAIVATDVLEHFSDLRGPVGIIQQLLKKGGFLFTSLPTENRLYALGRKVIGKQKPIDHYHSSKGVKGFLESHGYVIIHNIFAPKYLCVSIPLFEITIFRKE